MFTKSKIAAVALTTSLFFASTVQAEEVSLEQYVSGMVNQAMDVAQQEFQNNLRSAVLTVAHNVSFDEQKSYVPKVMITDLPKSNVEASKVAAE